MFIANSVQKPFSNNKISFGAISIKFDPKFESELIKHINSGRLTAKQKNTLTKRIHDLAADLDVKYKHKPNIELSILSHKKNFSPSLQLQTELKVNNDGCDFIHSAELLCFTKKRDRVNTILNKGIDYLFTRLEQFIRKHYLRKEITQEEKFCNSGIGGFF